MTVVENTNVVTVVSGKFAVKFAYNPEYVAIARQLADRRWMPDDKQWLCAATLSNAKHLIDNLGGFHFTDTFKVLVSTLEGEIKKSKAVSSDLYIPVPLGLEYLPFQKAGVAYAMDKANVMIGDEMGLGKTIQAIGLANLMNHHRVLVVCPAHLKINWKKEMEKWLVVPHTIGIASGGVFPETEIIIINYDILGKHHDALRAVEWDLLVFDESQYMKSHKAKRTHEGLGKWHKTDPITGIPYKQRVFLTGTPFINRPIELWPVLNAAGVFKSWKHFVIRYCAGCNSGWGWDVSGSSNMEELQTKLRGDFMVRRKKTEVLKELPAKVRQVIEIPANGLSHVVEKEKELLEKYDGLFTSLREAVAKASVEEDDEGYKKAVAALKEGNRAAFEDIARVRHETAVAKIPLVVTHIQDVLDNGKKVVLFAHHRDVIDALEEAFTKKSVVVKGGMSAESKDGAITKFQNNEETTLFIGQLQAAGTGITLTASSHVVFAELDWTPGGMSQCEDRCHRIGQVDSVLVQHLVLEGSIDALMAQTIVDKQKVIDKALDVEIAELVVPDNVEVSIVEKIREQEVEKAPEVVLHLADVLVIHEGLRILTGMCDGAVKQDQVGFNKFDVRVGHSLAARDELTNRQALLGKKILVKYSRQLPKHVNEIVRKG